MKSTVVLVQIDGEREIRGPVLLEPLCESADEIQFPNSLVHFGDNHSCYLRLVNPTGFTQKLGMGSCVGHASEVEWITADGQVSEAPSNQSNEGVGGEVVEVKTGGVGGKVVVVGESSESQETQISGVGGEVVEVRTGGVGGKVVVVGEVVEASRREARVPRDVDPVSAVIGESGDADQWCRRGGCGGEDQWCWREGCGGW